MPKVYLTKNQERRDKVRKIINYAKADGILKSEMRDAIGVSSAAFTLKQKDPGTLTLDELWRLLDFLHTPDDKRLEIIK